MDIFTSNTAIELKEFCKEVTENFTLYSAKEMNKTFSSYVAFKDDDRSKLKGMDILTGRIITHLFNHKIYIEKEEREEVLSVADYQKLYDFFNGKSGVLKILLDDNEYSEFEFILSDNQFYLHSVTNELHSEHEEIELDDR